MTATEATLGNPTACSASFSPTATSRRTVETLTQTEMTAAFKRAYKFVDQSRDASFREFSRGRQAPNSGWLRQSRVGGQRISQIRLIMMTNRVLSSRVDGHPDQAIADVPVTHSVWDLSRLWQRKASGRTREEIVIDVERDYGGALPVLPAHLDGADYEAYLIVFPGAQLAAIYSRWRARLLEQNVRVFLQARGGVNKGIRNTIENEPEMFFAYNNGITATAEGSIWWRTAGGPQGRAIPNLQIVNGGQTTASLHAACGRSWTCSQHLRPDEAVNRAARSNTGGRPQDLRIRQ